MDFDNIVIECIKCNMTKESIKVLNFKGDLGVEIQESVCNECFFKLQSYSNICPFCRFPFQSASLNENRFIHELPSSSIFIYDQSLIV